MFDLTDDVENSPNPLEKAKPTEVKIDYEVKDEKPKKEIPKNTETDTYEMSDDPDEDDKEW